MMAIYRVIYDTKRDRRQFYEAVVRVFSHLDALDVEVTSCRLVERRFEITTNVKIPDDQITHLELTEFF